MPVGTQEETKYEIRGELQQDDGDQAVWRDWAVVVPQVASASLEVTSDTPVDPGQEFQVAVPSRMASTSSGTTQTLGRPLGDRELRGSADPVPYSDGFDRGDLKRATTGIANGEHLSFEVRTAHGRGNLTSEL